MISEVLLVAVCCSACGLPMKTEVWWLVAAAG